MALQRLNHTIRGVETHTCDLEHEWGKCPHDSRSEYLKLYAARGKGRPSAEDSLGIATGNKVVTEMARRRAVQVLKWRHWKEFLELMKNEAEFLQTKSNVTPKG